MLRSGVGWLAGLALLLGAGCGPPRPERVVLVTIDTLRADHLGCYGAASAHTPTLDGLAAEGARFARAIAPTPITLPSHASILTGRIPPRHGVRNNSTFRLGDDVPTLAGRMGERGFATAAFVGAVVLDRQYGLSRGFDHYDDRMDPRQAAGERGFSERRADAVVDAALRWLRRAPSRFLLWVHLYDPHANYDPPPGFAAAFPGDPYAGEIAFADAQVGRLLREVEARFDDGRTLLVVTADHGESLGEHGEVTHSLTIYDATQHVPLLLRGPGVPAGRTVEALVGTVDVTPTVLAFLGEPPPPGMDGRDLRPLLRAQAEPDPDRAIYLETLVPQIDFGWSPLLGLRTARYAYVRAPRPELYDLREDPGEEHDLAAAQPELVARLDGRLGQRLAAGEARSTRLEPDAARREQLEQLGYVVPSGAAASGPALGQVGGTDPKDGLPTVQYVLRALQLMARGRPDDALALLKPLEGAGWALDGYRADAALAAQRFERAEQYARAAARRAPGRPDPEISLGRALEGQGRLDEAEAAYRRAAALDPANPEPWVGIGRLEEARGRLSAAASLYEQGAGMRAASAEALWRLAALRIEAGGDASDLLARLPARELRAPEPALRLARAELRAGRRTAAAQMLREALARHPEQAALKDALAAMPR